MFEICVSDLAKDLFSFYSILDSQEKRKNSYRRFSHSISLNSFDEDPVFVKRIFDFARHLQYCIKWRYIKIIFNDSFLSFGRFNKNKFDFQTELVGNIIRFDSCLFQCILDEYKPIYNCNERFEQMFFNNVLWRLVRANPNIDKTIITGVEIV